MLRNVVLSVATLVLGLTGLSATAAASSTTQQCQTMLDDVAVARDSLDRLEASLADMDSERAELTVKIDALELHIVAERAKGKPTMSLRADLDLMKAEVSLIDDLRPEILAQLEALRSSVDASERSYIACVETVIGS